MAENNRPKPVQMPDGQYERTPNEEKNALTDDDGPLKFYQRQIEGQAFDLGYGDLTVIYKVRRGKVFEAKIVGKSQTLQPF